MKNKKSLRDFVDVVSVVLKDKTNLVLEIFVALRKIPY